MIFSSERKRKGGRRGLKIASSRPSTRGLRSFVSVLSFFPRFALFLSRRTKETREALTIIETCSIVLCKHALRLSTSANREKCSIAHIRTYVNINAVIREHDFNLNIYSTLDY